MELEFKTKHAINVRSDGIKIFLDSNVLHGKYANILIENKIRKAKQSKILKEDKDDDDIDLMGNEDDITVDDLPPVDTGEEPENTLAGIGSESDEKDIEAEIGLEDKDKLEIIKKFIKPLIDEIAKKMGKNSVSKVTIDDEELSVNIDLDDVSIDELMDIVEVATAMLDDVTLEVVGEEEEEEKEEEEEEKEKPEEEVETECSETATECDKPAEESVQTEGDTPDIPGMPKEENEEEESEEEEESKEEKKIKEPEGPHIEAELESEKTLPESKFSSIYYENGLITTLTKNLVKQYLKSIKK